MGDIPAIFQSGVSAPLVTRARLAEMLGQPITEGVVTGWANRGLIPCVTIGKYSLVNLELLRKQCLDKEFR